MDTYFLAIGSAVWLGILTSISPCPLATNVAAVTFIGKQVDQPRKVLLSGLMYTLGRMFTYVVLGMILVVSLTSIPDLAIFLQRNINTFLGPILIVVGLLLLGVFKIKIPGFGVSTKFQTKVAGRGIWGAGLLGLLFALSFCPISAALFFGSLIPLAVEHNSSIAMPVAYGIGTAFPAVVLAIMIAFSARFLGKSFEKLALFERWARRVTGIVFILAGIYYLLTYIANIQIF